MADYTNATVYGLHALMAIFGISAVLFLVWAVKSGAVRDDEAPKYRMLEDDHVVPGDAAGAGNGGAHGDKD